MIWRFSDGTTVELGGLVDGPTLLAQRLRQQLAEGTALAWIWPQPSEPSAVDVNDAALVEAWLRSELDFWTRVRGLRLTLTSPDGIPPLPAPPWANTQEEPGVVY